MTEKDTPATTASAAKTGATSSPKASPTDTIVESWFQDKIQTSSISRQPECMDHLKKALVHLKKAVDGKDAKKAVEAVDGWFKKHIHGSPVSRHTFSYNHLYQAIKDLKDRLANAEV